MKHVKTFESFLFEASELNFEEIYGKKYTGYYSNFRNEDIANIIHFLHGVLKRTSSGLDVGIDKRILRDYFFKTPKQFQEKFAVVPSAKMFRGDEDLPCAGTYDKDHWFYLQSYSTENVAKFFGSYTWKATEIESYGGSFSTDKFNKIFTEPDRFYLRAFILYNDPDKEAYRKLFTFEQFISIFPILTGHGAMGRKYKNKLIKYLKDNGIDFHRDYVYLEDIEIGDDEGEIMFFDVVYKCEKDKK